jgi:disulfide bond formation protein DsbB
LDTPTFSRFFAILSLLCWGGVIAVIAVMVAARVAPRSRAPELVAALRDASLWLGAIVAIVTTLGSLYYSEVAHFVPCALCWYQRICMYPLSVILLVAALRRDTRVWLTAGPLVVIGLGLSIYHTQLQAWPSQGSSFCTTLEPCTVRYVWEFGFVSLPFMAFAAFAFIGVMLLLSRSSSPVMSVSGAES